MKHPSMEFNNKNKKRSLFALISLIFLFLLSFNGASIFSVNIPALTSTATSPEKLAGESSLKEETPSVISIPHLKLQTHSPDKPVAAAGLPHRRRQQETAPARDENENENENPNGNPNTHLPLSRKSHSLSFDFENSPIKNKKILNVLGSSSGRRKRDYFSAAVKDLFSKKSESSSCKIRFFMTWILPLNSFTDREFHSIESLFKTHPNGCLLIVSNSMDSTNGKRLLKPFSEKGFRVKAVSPDFDYLFKNTMAESWFSRLIRGHVHPGDVPLGQNFSNLLRLSLLYKFGGVYLDTDIVVLKNFAKLKNTIGAQTMDSDSRKWSRLNNAVMVFDKMHPLVNKFIDEFALTFNGNRWGHNGPYLVSRVVSRLQGKPGYNFTVLPPVAFYPVNWDRVRILFRGAENESDSRLLRGKLEKIRSQSYTVHLWNKQSRGFRIEDGSILRKILSDRCVFCNSSSTMG